MDTHTPVIAIFGNLHQDGYLPAVNRFISELAQAGIQLYVSSRFAEYMERTGFPLSYSPSINICHIPPTNTSIVISLGGDGTFLRTVQWIGDLPVPILGINTGHLGFLASCTLHDTQDLVQSIISNRFRCEQRSLLMIESPSLPPEVWPYALNELAIIKEETASMISVRTSLDGRFLADWQVDGLIISTPTGSTGYNLSAGGPILQPTLDVWAIAPIAPHSLTMRPLVVDAASSFAAITRSRSGFYRLALDGRSFPMPAGSRVTIRRAPFKAAVLCSHDRTFSETMRDKLHWGK